ncbi:MAG: hypothetical protein HYV42_00210 [Candidatus Magasanikbacteria bacterium]|nr:hypothetical protein [Candidatus Magasanikbacteria bacterium]
MADHQAWIVAVDMGYGHQRAAYPLRHLAPTHRVLVANNYPGLPPRDFNVWNRGRRIYEFFSRLSTLPVLGGFFFSLLDSFQKLPPFYPHRDLSAANLQLRQIYGLLRRGWLADLVRFLNQRRIPLITTFFTVAFAAEEHGFRGDIYVVICDSDISRTWAPLNPGRSRIRYLAPCRRVVERLKLYGVPAKQIFLTGFPLPQENIGDDLEILRADMAERLINLDPEKRYRSKYAETVKQFLKGIKIEARHHHPLTLTFAVGGAGAQRAIADDIIKSLKPKLLRREINLNLVAGTRPDVFRYFRGVISRHGVEPVLGENLRIIFAREKHDYFRNFNIALRTTDVLWTKPSELVFYSALGLPIIMAPSLGSQEDFNRLWLKTIGAGISQNDPRYAHEWLFDWINSGWLAEAAMSGYLDGRQFGVRNIMDAVFHGVQEPAADDSLL